MCPPAIGKPSVSGDEGGGGDRGREGALSFDYMIYAAVSIFGWFDMGGVGGGRSQGGVACLTGVDAVGLRFCLGFCMVVCIVPPAESSSNYNSFSRAGPRLGRRVVRDASH